MVARGRRGAYKCSARRLSFFFLPLVFKYVKSFLRAVIILLICYILLLAFATGSRGTFIFPFVFFGVGTYFFKTRFLKTFRFIRLDVVAIGSCALILPLLLLMDHFRNTQTFREKRTIDIVGRFSAIGEAFDRIEVMDANAQADNENVRLVSRAHNVSLCVSIRATSRYHARTAWQMPGCCAPLPIAETDLLLRADG